MNVFIPMAEVPGLSVPPLAITDGSADPTWIELPCQGRFVYGRRRRLRLPFDAATADVARRWLRFDRRRRTVWTPIILALVVALFFPIFYPGDHRVLRYVLHVAYVGALFWIYRSGKKVEIAQHPQLVGRLGVYLPAVSEAVAREWVAHNVAVQVVPERPRWRRYPSRVYLCASGLCAVVGAGVWWGALRDGTFGLTSLLAFVLLLGAAVVLAFKALPAGFIRLGDAPGGS